MTTTPRVRLGPNHPDYAESIAQPFYTLSQLLKRYAAEHDKRARAAGGPCACLLCADFRAHVAAHKAGRNGGPR
jgi:hypothetical protein